MADSAQLRFKAACERFGIPCRREGDHFVITDEDVEREVFVFPATDEQARTEVVIEDEAQLCDFEGGNLEVVPQGHGRSSRREDAARRRQSTRALRCRGGRPRIQA